MRLLIIFILVLAVTSCKSRKSTSEGDSGNDGSSTVSEVNTKDSLFASYEKTPCFGLCPVFELTIYKSGLAHYKGTKNVDMIGAYQGFITAGDLDGILSVADEIDYFKMEDAYDGQVTDLPSTIYVINGEEKKEVLDRYRGPKELKQLSDKLDALIKKTNWTKMSSSNSDY